MDVYSDHEIWMMNNLTFGNRLEFQSSDRKPIHKAGRNGETEPCNYLSFQTSQMLFCNLNYPVSNLIKICFYTTCSWYTSYPVEVCHSSTIHSPYATACQVLFLALTFVCMGLITDIFNYTANNLSICMDFPANIRANRVVWRAESVKGEK